MQEIEANFSIYVCYLFADEEVGGKVLGKIITKLLGWIWQACETHRLKNLRVETTNNINMKIAGYLPTSSINC